MLAMLRDASMAPVFCWGFVPFSLTLSPEGREDQRLVGSGVCWEWSVSGDCSLRMNRGSGGVLLFSYGMRQKGRAVGAVCRGSVV